MGAFLSVVGARGADWTNGNRFGGIDPFSGIRAFFEPILTEIRPACGAATTIFVARTWTSGGAIRVRLPEGGDLR